MFDLTLRDTTLTHEDLKRRLLLVAENLVVDDVMDETKNAPRDEIDLDDHRANDAWLLETIDLDRQLSVALGCGLLEALAVACHPHDSLISKVLR